MFKRRFLDVAAPNTRETKAQRLPGTPMQKAFQRHISERKANYPSFQKKFEHIRGNTIAGAPHKSAVITRVERLTKVIITLVPAGRKP
ncbi:hypothetical protein [Planococcus kocurii]|uniref:hypothetical protein n=1 Tax=Planococcus kocurii TaxID=1374 RepID=UPI00147033CC|nr:hypothetical protein [Planococcus kocurii]